MARPSLLLLLLGAALVSRESTAEVLTSSTAVTRTSTPASRPPPAAPDPARDRVEVSAAPGKGATIRAGDHFALTTRARIQVRETISEVTSTTSELNVKTLRLHLQGFVLSPELRYTIQLAFGPADFDPSSASPIFDAFVEYLGIRDLNIRVGQYFVPFDRARTVREFALQLVDRQQVIAELAFERDTGVTLSSQDLFGLGGKLAYHLGIFGGSGRNRVGGEPVGFLYTARLGLRPFGAFDDDIEADVERSPDPRLAIGVAGAYNQKATRQRSTLGNTYALGTFDYVHAAGDVVFKWRGFSFLGEALYRRADAAFLEGDVNGQPTREWTRSGWGYVVQAGLMVTRHLEIAGRWDQLRTIGETDPALAKLVRDQGREAGGGLNLYLNGHAFKLQADYVARFGPSSYPTNHLVRFQVDATF